MAIGHTAQAKPLASTAGRGPRADADRNIRSTHRFQWIDDRYGGGRLVGADLVTLRYGNPGQGGETSVQNGHAAIAEPLGDRHESIGPV